MATARRITESEHYLRRGEWKNWRYDLFSGADIHDTTLGIIGMGRIGQGIARRGHYGFNMRVLYYNRTRLPEHTERESGGATHVSKEQLLQESDHVVLVVPYSGSSHHIISTAELSLMKPTATLTNIARGGIVDEKALVVALREGRIAAAGLDVFEGEPQVNPDLLALSNVVLTPHIASSSLKTRLAMSELTANNLIAALGYGEHAGKPFTPVNPEVYST